MKILQKNQAMIDFSEPHPALSNGISDRLLVFCMTEYWLNSSKE
ncbi:MAG: hypothetical protein FD166_919 [Bacteroidetes bacterium]|nr:MAG: hypothetical protein FD166_919 [Bacteroidota bacterium]